MQLARQLLEAQEDIFYLGQKKSQLEKKVTEQKRAHEDCKQRYNENIQELESENVSSIFVRAGKIENFSILIFLIISGLPLSRFSNFFLFNYFYFFFYFIDFPAFFSILINLLPFFAFLTKKFIF